MALANEKYSIEYGSLRFSSSQTKIPSGFFKDNDEITHISLRTDAGIEEISDEAFRGCKQIDFVVLPKSLKHLGSECFSDCDSLRNVSISLESIQSIGNNPFGESAYNKELGLGVRTLLCGTISSPDTIQKWHQLYGFDRRASQNVTVGFNKDGEKLTICYSINFPAGNAIYPQSDFGDTSPLGYEKTEPRIYVSCAEIASQEIPLVLETLDGTTYPIENWDYCRDNHKFLMEEAKEQHDALNDPKHPWSFVVNDVPVKTFDINAYLMKVYYNEVELTDSIFIVWDNF